VDALGRAIIEGREAASYLWQVPGDAETRARVAVLLKTISRDSAKAGRSEMPRLCEDLLLATKASPSPQQVDLLQDGFDRLYRLWGAAKSGLM
jgi:hypothetical protein